MINLPAIAFSIFLRISVFTGMWILLTEGMIVDVPLAAVIILLATASSYWVLPSRTLSEFRLTGLIHFAWFFVIQSLRGGIDVAWRALHPSLPVKPVLITEPLHIKGEGLRILYAWTVSLLPGTASVHLTEDSLTVHMLIKTPTTERDLEKLEEVILGLQTKTSK